MPRSLSRQPSAARGHKRCRSACSLDRIGAENGAVDTQNHHPRLNGRPKTYSHIINLPTMSTDAVDTPLIPHLSPSSCNERKRCGIGFGGRLLLCVLDVVCVFLFYFYRGAEQVVMQMTSQGKPLSAPRTPVPRTPVKYSTANLWRTNKEEELSPIGLLEQHLLIGYEC